MSTRPPDYAQSGVDLYEGDALEVLSSLPEGAVVCMITDPPYGIGREPTSSARKRYGNKHRVTGDQDQAVGQAVIDWAFSRSLTVATFAHPSRPWSGPWQCWLVWDKGPAAGGGYSQAPWKLTWELIQVGGLRIFREGRDAGVITQWVAPVQGDFALHPCQKPLPVLRHLVSKLTRPGDTVLDPFMGSGSTALACLRLGRRFIGVEMDPHYFRVARERLSGSEGPLFSSSQATLPFDG